MTIEEVEQRIESAICKLRSPEYEPLQDALQPLIPQSFRPRVVLYEAGRKKKRNASSENWSPESGEIRISFEPIPSPSPGARKPKVTPPEARPGKTTSNSQLKPPAPDPLSDLIHALDRAES